MTNEAPLRCACGSMRGRARELAPPRGLHLTCYCADCQAFADYLGKRETQLDDWGGSAIVQIAPARIELSEGAEHLACMRLSEGGLMRWYAGCCNTAIANTMAKAAVPFTGMYVHFIDPDFDAGERDALLGPSRANVNGRALSGTDAPVKVDAFPVRVIGRSLLNIARSWRRNEHWPSPFFDADGEPRATPTVLSTAERDALRVHQAQ
ncbi:DUF6151 family protein [Plesiocystis pacifica]|nr:DUF6151 family protein [Plesiocystis pacifica]